MEEIRNTLKDKFSISLGQANSIRIESIKAQQEKEMERVRERVKLRKEQIGKKVKEFISSMKKEPEAKQNLNT